MSPSNNGQPYPGDSDLFSGEPRGASMTEGKLQKCWPRTLNYGVVTRSRAHEDPGYFVARERFSKPQQLSTNAAQN